jgi:hypothetical protein
MDSSPLFKQLRLRRPDRCVVCELELAAGQKALWYGGPRVVTCVGCRLEAPAVIETAAVAEPSAAVEALSVEGQPGASALREYERRHRAREQRARAKLGALGRLLARVVDEPQSGSRPSARVSRARLPDASAACR